MKTELLRADRPEDVQHAGQLLKAGQLVAVPTETVYGLAADASNPEAVAGIFVAKGRPRNHPLITHLGSIDQLPEWATDIPACVESLIKAFWPGPLTLLLKRNPAVSDVITGGLPTIGLRMPDHPVLLELLQSQRLAVAAPSANPYQKLSPTTAAQVLAGLAGRIAAILDGGPCAIGTESTILRIGPNNAEILRSGPITAARLQPYLPFPVTTPASHTQAVSGNQQVHYRPNAPLSLRSAHELRLALPHLPHDLYCIVHSPELRQKAGKQVLALPDDHAGYRKALYASLHTLDQAGAGRIWVETPPEEPQWLDIRDRLERASEG